MEKLLLSLTGLLFLTTWTCFTLLVMQPEEKIYSAKNHYISDETLVSKKESTSLYAKITSIPKNNGQTDQINLDDWAHSHSSEGVSIDTLLDVLDLQSEAAPNS